MGKSASKTAKEKSHKRKSSKRRKGGKGGSEASPSADEAPTPNAAAEPPPTEASQSGAGTSQPVGTDVQRSTVEPKKPVEYLPAVVIDVGSYSCKYGLAGEQSPDGEVKTIVGRHQQDQDDSFVGNDALNKRSVLDLNYPIQRGLVKNWDDMEIVWEYIYKRKLRVDPDTRPVVLTEPALNPKANRAKMIELMFEKFDVPAFYLVMQSMCALFSTGMMTGVVVDIGDGVTDIVSINNAVVVENSVRRLELAGMDITEHMKKSPAARGEKITNEVAQTMKISTCEVVADFDEVTRLQREGQDVHHLYATEALFDPSIFGRTHPGIHSTIMDSIMACGEPARDQVGSNVVLAGGSTLFRGFHDRMERELLELAPPTMPLQVLDRQDREAIIWSGASLFASLPAFKQQAISKEEYFEVGPEIVHRKR